MPVKLMTDYLEITCGYGIRKTSTTLLPFFLAFLISRNVLFMPYCILFRLGSFLYLSVCSWHWGQGLVIFSNFVSIPVYDRHIHTCFKHADELRRKSDSFHKIINIQSLPLRTLLVEPTFGI